MAYSITTTASSGLAVVYTSNNTAVATVSNSGVVTITGAGTATITVSQAGNNNYNPATSLIHTITVQKANQTITFNPLSNKLATDLPFTLNGTTSSGLALTYSSSDSTIASISGNTVTILSSGTVTITASQLGNSNYNAATDDYQELIINKAN